jgi:hypothetical protein
MPADRLRAAVLAGGVTTAGAFGIAEALKASSGRAVIVACAVGAVGAAVAAAATSRASVGRQNRVAVPLVAAAAVLLTCVLYLVLAVMFFSH